MQSALVLQDNRLGSQEVQINAVQIQDLGGNDISNITAGQPLKIMLHYEATEPVEGGIFGASISSENGTVCLEVSTSGVDDGRTTLSGTGTIALELFEVDLRPGPYFVDVGIYEREWQYAYDYHWHVYPLEIRRREAHKGHRTVPHRWSVPD